METECSQIISTESPTGSNVCYTSDAYDAVSSEIDKLSSPTAGDISWQVVIEKSKSVLIKESKDLKIASYLSYAHTYVNRIEALSSSCLLLNHIIENFWEDLYPKKIRARKGAITWWIEKTEGIIENLCENKIEHGTSDKVLESLNCLEETLTKYFPDSFSLSQISRNVRAASRPQEDTSPEKRAESVNNNISKPTQQAGTTDITPQHSENITPEALAKSIDEKLRQVASYLLKEDLTDHLAYKYKRVAIWSRLKQLPPVTKNNQTKCPPPPLAKIKELEDYFEKQQWSLLITLSEKLLTQHAYWLDLNYYTSKALMALNNTYMMAYQVVVEETVALIKKMPQITTLAFVSATDDAMPFASAETIQWLDEISGKTSIASPTVEISSKPDETTLESARVLLKGGESDRGIRLLYDDLQRATTEQNRTSCRLALIKFSMEANKLEITIPHVKKLLETVQFFNLELWDAKLATLCLFEAYNCLKTQKDDKSKQLSKEILERITMLDINLYLEMQK